MWPDSSINNGKIECNQYTQFCDMQFSTRQTLIEFTMGENLLLFLLLFGNSHISSWSFKSFSLYMYVFAVVCQKLNGVI